MWGTPHVSRSTATGSARPRTMIVTECCARAARAWAMRSGRAGPCAREGTTTAAVATTAAAAAAAANTELRVVIRVITTPLEIRGCDEIAHFELHQTQNCVLCAGPMPKRADSFTSA